MEPLISDSARTQFSCVPMAIKITSLVLVSASAEEKIDYVDLTSRENI